MLLITFRPAETKPMLSVAEILKIMNNKKRQSDTFDEALENLKSKGIKDIFLEDWNNTIPKDFTELVRKEMRGKMEQKMTIYLARRTNSNYKNFWYELFHFYINPQINKFPKLNV